MRKSNLWREIAERVVVLLLLLVSGGFSLWTAKTASVGLPAPDKQEAQNYTSLFWFVGTLLLMAAVGIFVDLLFWLQRLTKNQAKK